MLENQTQLGADDHINVETFGDFHHHPTEGIEATLIERGARYGDYRGQSIITQRLKEEFRKPAGWARLNLSQRETLDMIASKVARILNGDPNYADSWHDIAGYATLVERELGQ